MSKKTDIIFGIERTHFVFQLAKDYFEKGLEATKQAHPASFDFATKRPTWRLSFPICALSLSLELAIKGFLKDDQLSILRKSRKGHSLISLYKNLSSDTRLAIENHYETCKAHKFNFFNLILKPKTSNAKQFSGDTTQETILNALELCNEPFIDFRYLHEFENRAFYFDFNTVIKLIHCCLAVKANELGIKLEFVK